MQGKNMIYAIRWLKKNFIMITYENKGYDKLDKWITLTHTHQKMYDENIFKREWRLKKGNLFNIKGPNKKEELKLGFVPCKLLEDGFLGDDENICNIHMYHHPIRMDV